MAATSAQRVGDAGGLLGSDADPWLVVVEVVADMSHDLSVRGMVGGLDAHDQDR